MSIQFNDFKKTFLLLTSPYLFKNKAARIRWVLSILLILVDVTATSLIPYFSKNIVNSLSINLTHSVWFAISFLGIFWILEKTVMHIQEIIFFPNINSTIRNITYNVVQHLHQISLLDYKKLSISEIINAIRRISLSARSFIKILLLMIIPTLLKLAVAIFMTIQAGLFGLILFPSIFLAFFILYKGTQQYIKAREIAWQASDQVIVRINDSLLNTKIVRAFESFEMAQLSELLNQEATLWYKSNTRLHTIYILLGILIGLMTMVILVWVILAIQQGKLSVGDFVFLKGQLIAAFLPFRTFSLEFRQLAEALVDIKKIIKIFEIPAQKSSQFSANSSAIFKPGIYLKNVHFSYDKVHKIFNNLSLHIPVGEKLVIIGESGCGKSTLINLMASLYKPNQGHIYLDGEDINSDQYLSPQKLYCISQDFKLFNTSLRNNITYGLGVIPTATLIDIAKQVGILDMLQKLPQGLDTLVGEMGAKLSGGERQKVALMRALLLKPNILLLDETTSAINFEKEKIILKAIIHTIPTVIFATHRVSMLSYFDRILKIKFGTLFEMKKSVATRTESVS